MQLKNIHVSGFKSFVDPLSITIPANLVGVVGPNGCGKSNIIDAVRWVMGEASAKNLRGESMTDVIFNGSADRKPVGKATVELVFDNSEGMVTGPYGRFAEIAIRRSLTRDGVSEYSINRATCRRRDITDILINAGLGPRSYSVIEQGMVSRIIESKPEDLRALVEQAAGTAKFKERRRDTETRIRHTRENLDRVADIRDELGAQLRRLQRQSRAAKRYKTLREEEKVLQGQLLSLRWQALNQNLAIDDRDLASLETNTEACLAGQREVEREIGALREQQGAEQDQLNTIQGEFYRLGAEVAGVEQSIEHAQETRQQRQEELERLSASTGDIDQQLQVDHQLLRQVKEELSEATLDFEAAQKHEAETRVLREQTEQNWGSWQSDWERLNQESARPARNRDVLLHRVEDLQQLAQDFEERHQKLATRSSEIEALLQGNQLQQLREETSTLDKRCHSLEKSIEQMEVDGVVLRTLVDDETRNLDSLRDHKHQFGSRLGTLEELQRHALGGDDADLADWLQKNKLDLLPRISETIRVEEGWECALEQLLGSRLTAVCVENLDSLTLNQPNSGLTLVESRSFTLPVHKKGWARLADKIDNDHYLGALLSGVYCADSLEQAQSERHSLESDECFVTRRGEVIGLNWISYGAEERGSDGVLSREAEINTLQSQIGSLEGEIETQRDHLSKSRQQLDQLRNQREESGRQLRALITTRTERHNRLGREEARFGELDQQREQIEQEVVTIDNQRRDCLGDLKSTRERYQQAVTASKDFDQQRQKMEGEREGLHTSLVTVREQHDQSRIQLHTTELRYQRLTTAETSTSDSITRQQEQMKTMFGRKKELEGLFSETGEPNADLKERLQSLLDSKLVVESTLQEARQKLTQIEDQLVHSEKSRLEREQAVDSARSQVADKKILRQEVLVRQSTLEEEIKKSGAEPKTLFESCPEGATENDWDEKLAVITRKIERIGPVNLVAIEEFDEQTQRKTYLDQQHADLTEALDSLESVIKKIDRETRARFRETFIKLNQGFEEYFPKLFHGGKATLNLTSDDSLSCGVTVLAQPPGKRNSTIHLLSGGEKALTAIALLFAFFHLNPSPFCLLDEVDAPMDDVNVDRYCQILKSLSERTQLIVITHNKITMASADVLVGVTMGELGVSRLVTVDIDEAVKLADS
ncbi:MAG: chromosome segregation protein SMC [Arenicellales bacterium]|nr:chromosome segregation protein SMC [Arenicellales bacterium]